jgi:hypothetical protein
LAPGISGNQREFFAPRLGDEHPVERVAVDPGIVAGGNGVFEADR